MGKFLCQSHLNDHNADLNENGQSNFEDWIWGINPVIVTPARPLDIPPNTSGTFNYTRRAQSLSGYSFSVWYSTDLMSWMEDTGATQTAGGPGSDNVETVNVTPSPAVLNRTGVFFQMRAVRGE